MLHILTDSTADLSPELIREYGLTVLPLHILLGEEDYLDGTGISFETIYDWSDRHKSLPKTAAPSVDEAKKALRPLIENGDEVICFSISASMSASNSILNLAVQQLHAQDRVSVIDSANLSTGIGHLVLYAAEEAAKGLRREEIVRRVMEMRDRVRASFVVDTLEYLHRGGRYSGLSAFMGSVLRLHPKIVVEHGAMRPDHKYRGHIDSVIVKYVHDMEEALKKAQPERVFITHSSCERETVEAVRAYLEGLRHFERVLETNAGGVVSSHCGPGTLGVLYVDPKE